MIFVTVGAQMPFDRLVRTVDEWAGKCGRDDVLAQVGAARYRPKHLHTVELLPPAELRRRMAEADAVVAHAGMGTIITALDLAKPLLCLPRLRRHGETRNDHQVATARQFAGAGRLLAAYDEAELLAALERVEAFRPARPAGAGADPALLRRVREYALCGGGPV